jgi:hypothetical protein
MRKRFVLTCLMSAVILVVQVGGASAHVATYDTSLSIDKSPNHAVHRGDRVLIMGKLKPKACRKHKVIRLMKVVKGPDKLLAKDRTDREGEYLFKLRARRTMKVYTRFRGSVTTGYNYGTYYGHSHTCNPSRSKSVKIRVRR